VPDAKDKIPGWGVDIAMIPSTASPILVGVLKLSQYSRELRQPSRIARQIGSSSAIRNSLA